MFILSRIKLDSEGLITEMVTWLGFTRITRTKQEKELV